MSKVAQYRKGELFERRVVVDNLLQDRNRTERRSFFLSCLRKTTQIEECVKKVILNLLQRIGQICQSNSANDEVWSKERSAHSSDTASKLPARDFNKDLDWVGVL